VGYRFVSEKNTSQIIRELKQQMREASDNLDFELAAILRDRMFELEGKSALTGPGTKSVSKSRKPGKAGR
jgi:excinuclease UvrABC nuclease subunit